MAYQQTKAKLADHMIEPEVLRDILETMAGELEEAEPYATKSIETIRYTAGAVMDLED